MFTIFVVRGRCVHIPILHWLLDSAASIRQQWAGLLRSSLKSLWSNSDHDLLDHSKANHQLTIAEKIWRFPKYGVPPNHAFLDVIFPLWTIHLGVPPWLWKTPAFVCEGPAEAAILAINKSAISVNSYGGISIPQYIWVNMSNICRNSNICWNSNTWGISSNIFQHSSDTLDHFTWMTTVHSLHLFTPWLPVPWSPLSWIKCHRVPDLGSNTIKIDQTIARNSILILQTWRV